MKTFLRERFVTSLNSRGNPQVFNCPIILLLSTKKAAKINPNPKNMFTLFVLPPFSTPNSTAISFAAARNTTCSQHSEGRVIQLCRHKSQGKGQST